MILSAGYVDMSNTEKYGRIITGFLNSKIRSLTPV